MQFYTISAIILGGYLTKGIVIAADYALYLSYILIYSMFFAAYCLNNFYLLDLHYLG